MKLNVLKKCFITLALGIGGFSHKISWADNSLNSPKKQVLIQLPECKDPLSRPDSKNQATVTVENILEVALRKDLFSTQLDQVSTKFHILGDLCKKQPFDDTIIIRGTAGEVHLAELTYHPWDTQGKTGDWQFNDLRLVLKPVSDKGNLNELYKRAYQYLTAHLGKPKFSRKKEGKYVDKGAEWKLPKSRFEIWLSQVEPGDEKSTEAAYVSMDIGVPQGP